jgi:DNA-binding CsgD family transcriptional regulator
MRNPGSRKNISAGSAVWIEHLSACIDSIGEVWFSQRLEETLKVLTEFDHMVVFAYYQSEKPSCLSHSFPSENRVVFVDDYLKGPYLLDPFFKTCNRQMKPGLYRLRDIAPDRFYQSEYYRSYYIRTGLSEEIGFIFYLRHGVAVVVSIMRSGESARFSAREFRLLEGVVPLVISLAQRHWKNVPEQFSAGTENGQRHDERSVIEEKVSALFGPRITPRETQVVAQVLEGHSSDSIARNLKISVGTVRIHRRNVYAKLQISSQQELFSMFFKEITGGSG